MKNKKAKIDTREAIVGEMMRQLVDHAITNAEMISNENRTRRKSADDANQDIQVSFNQYRNPGQHYDQSGNPEDQTEAEQGRGTKKIKITRSRN